MTNIIAAVILNHFSIPRIMFLVSMKKWVFLTTLQAHNVCK